VPIGDEALEFRDRDWQGSAFMGRSGKIMFRWVPTAIAATLTLSAYAAEPELYGTWKLVSAERKILDTGETEDLTQQGYITYGADGRMMVLNVVAGRRSSNLAILNIRQDQELRKPL
jgi:Lipocalin-like domain